MARLPRLSVANYPHHIIQRGNNRQVICADEADFEQLLTLLREAAQRHRVALYSWVLLPEQMQIIATPETAEGVPRMMQDMGRAYVRYFNNRYVRTGTLWEWRYRNTVLDPERVVAAMVCLDWLPVHRQLAEQPRDWVWSSSAFYRYIAPTQHHLAFGFNRAFNFLLTRQTAGMLFGHKHHAHAIFTHGRQLHALRRHFFAVQRIGQLDQNTSAVAHQLVGTHRTTVVQVFQNFQGLGYDGMAFFATHVGHKAYAAGIMFVRSRVQALLLQMQFFGRTCHGVSRLVYVYTDAEYCIAPRIPDFLGSSK